MNRPTISRSDYLKGYSSLQMRYLKNLYGKDIIELLEDAYGENKKKTMTDEMEYAYKEKKRIRALKRLHEIEKGDRVLPSTMKAISRRKTRKHPFNSKSNSSRSRSRSHTKSSRSYYTAKSNPAKNHTPPVRSIYMNRRPVVLSGLSK